MNSKIIKFGDEARKELAIGVNTVGDIARVTIGPKGRNVIFDGGFGGPTIANDSGSISREVVMKDPIQNIGANVTKEVAQKTNDMAGDGRTTSVILMQSIFNGGMKKLTVSRFDKLKAFFLSFLFIKKTRISSVGIKKGVEKASKVAVAHLKSISKPINSDEEITRVAIISSESEEIGNKISETIKELGTDSIITVEEGQTMGLFSEVSIGMEFDKGFISPYMEAYNKERMEVVLEEPHILVTDIKIGSIDSIVPLLEKVMQSGKREFVIIADDVVGEALKTFVINNIRGTTTILCIKAPGFGLRKKDYLEDIATVVGAKFISGDMVNLSKVELSDLGSADKVISKKDKTTIVRGKGTQEAIDDRIRVAKAELETLESKHDKLKVDERIARLSGGVAIIKVGAATEQDTKYQKLKIEDAVNSVKAALEEGIVPGGGIALISASKAVLEAKRALKNQLTTDEMIGFDILANALEVPLQCIAINCGLGDGLKVVSTVKKIKTEGGGFGGFDALKNHYVRNMIESGIVNPTKVERSAIENAASAGGILLTTEVALATESKMSPTGN